jgi:hypothetical protein
MKPAGGVAPHGGRSTLNDLSGPISLRASGRTTAPSLPRFRPLNSRWPPAAVAGADANGTEARAPISSTKNCDGQVSNCRRLDREARRSLSGNPGRRGYMIVGLRKPAVEPRQRLRRPGKRNSGVWADEELRDRILWAVVYRAVPTSDPHTPQLEPRKHPPPCRSARTKAEDICCPRDLRRQCGPTRRARGFGRHRCRTSGGVFRKSYRPRLRRLHEVIRAVARNLSDKHEFTAMRAFDAPRQSKFVRILVDDLPSENGDKKSWSGVEQCRQQAVESGRFSLE